MFDVVLPKDNEEQLIAFAQKIGCKELVFLSTDLKYKPSTTKSTIKKAFLLKNPDDFKKAKNTFDYIVAPAQRKFFERKVDYIIDAELFDGKDSVHYRKTQLNQVHAKLAKDNGITIVFNFNNLLLANHRERQIILGRMMQNAVLCRKYKVKIAVWSMARIPLEMKSSSIRDSLKRVLRL